MGLLLTMAADSSAHHRCVWKLQSSNKLTLMDRVCSAYRSAETMPQHTAVAWQRETLLALCWGLGRPVPRRWVPQQRAAQNNTGMPSNRKDSKNYILTSLGTTGTYLFKDWNPRAGPRTTTLLLTLYSHHMERNPTCDESAGCSVESVWNITGLLLGGRFSAGPHHHWGQWQGGTCLGHRLFLGPRFCVSLTPVSWGCGFQGCR